MTLINTNINVLFTCQIWQEEKSEILKIIGPE